MKKLLLPIIALFLISGYGYAQDANDAFKEAKKAYGKIALSSDAEQSAKDLAVAVENIEIASAKVNELSEKDVYKMWQTKSAIYNEVAKNYITRRLLNKESKEKMKANDAQMAFEAAQEALAVSTKGWQTKQIAGQLLETANYLVNYGGYYYDFEDYAGAYNSFNLALQARKILKENGVDEFIPAEEDYQEQVYSTAICASLAGEKEESLKLYTQLYDANYAKPAVYDGLFKAKVGDNETEALAILAKGRELFPEDQGLLVTEINYYLGAGKLETLIDKLEEGIKQDPDNVSFITTLGQVYDELGNKEMEAGNVTQADEYNQKAMDYFKESLEKDPENYTAMYNIGVIYYNKAAILTKDLITLESDYSKAGIEKYKAKQAEIFAMFDKALPYFQDAEKIAPNDLGTLIALKEIYAKKDDLPTSNEFKNRIEKINNGEEIEASYFK